QVLARRVAQHAARVAPQRPLTILALGPTGVGKTRTARALAEALGTTGAPGAYTFLRLDMNEYAEAYRGSQLLGAPQGDAGYGDSAQLVDTLVSNPRTLVLLDEIDKAHPKIMYALMNAMDAGRLSTPAKTSQGRDIDVRRSIFFLTSNAEAEPILADLSVADAE